MKKKMTALQYVIYLLSRQDYSEFKIREKLHKREHSKEEIEEAIRFCLDQHYLDDSRYCRGKIRSGIYKGHGWYRISQQLQLEKLSQDVIDNALYRYEQEEGELNWKELAKEALERRYKSPIDSPKEKARRARFLQSRGFSFDEINFALSFDGDRDSDLFIFEE